MHRNPFLGATLFLFLLIGGCSADETRKSPAGSDQVTISDAEIDSYSEWWRQKLALDRKHLKEMNELQDHLNRKYSLADLHRVPEDPELLAMLKRQREVQMEHQRNKPISREKADGFDSVLAGLGRTVTRDGRTVYEVYHEERALKGARYEYGDKFVDKVLSRENDIAAAMNP